MAWRAGKPSSHLFGNHLPKRRDTSSDSCGVGAKSYRLSDSQRIAPYRLQDLNWTKKGVIGKRGHCNKINMSRMPRRTIGVRIGSNCVIELRDRHGRNLLRYRTPIVDLRQAVAPVVGHRITAATGVPQKLAATVGGRDLCLGAFRTPASPAWASLPASEKLHRSRHRIVYLAT